MIEALHLRKTFIRSVAVDDVSFQLRKGEILGLIGPNGAGKTTTIRIVLNILKPDAGEVLYEGNPFSEQSRNLFGYLPEERGLYRKSRVLDTITYFGCLRGMRKPFAREQALKWLESFDLARESNRKIEELSKGNQQKLQFIVAVVHDPWLVVLDEPFSGLDPLNQVTMQEIVAGLRNAGKAVILSTHQMDYAEKLSDAICLMHEGKVLLRGTVPELRKRYGTNTVRMEFSGDGSVLATIPGIKKVILSQSGAECELADGETTGRILGILSQKLDLRKFELVEPTLNSIFLDVVHKKNSPQSSGRVH